MFRVSAAFPLTETRTGVSFVFPQNGFAQKIEIFFQGVFLFRQNEMAPVQRTCLLLNLRSKQYLDNCFASCKYINFSSKEAWATSEILGKDKYIYMVHTYGLFYKYLPKTKGTD